MKNYVFILILSLSFSKSIYCQNTGKIISVSFQNKTLQDVFHELTKKTGCNFSFNAGLIPLDETINIQFTNKNLSFILASLLQKYQLGFTEVNNQIVIYALAKKTATDNKTSKDPSLAPINTKITGREKSDSTYQIKYKINRSPQVLFYDTIRKTIIDTIYHYDTLHIEHYDTVKIYDTISVIKKIEPKQPKLKVFYPYMNYEISFAVEKNSYVLQNKDASQNFFNAFVNVKTPGTGFQINTTININYRNFIIQTGLGYRYYSESWGITRRNHGGYFTKDTISRYYTQVQGQDTTWVYVTKDKWIETLTISDIKTQSKYHYINLPIFVGYRLPYKKLIFELKGGFVANFLIQAGGEAIVSKDTLMIEKINTKKVPFSIVNLAIYLGTTVSFPIDKNTAFILEPFYSRNLFSTYKKNYWYSQKLVYPGIKLAIRKKF